MALVAPKQIRLDELGEALSAAIEVSVIEDVWVLVDSRIVEVDNFTWRVQAAFAGSSSKVSEFVAATHNGVGASPPDAVQWTIFGKLKFGTPTLQVDIRLVDVGGNLTLGLWVRTAEDAEIKAWRM